MDDGIDGSGRPYRKGQREDNGGGESRGAEEQADRVPKIPHETSTGRLGGDTNRRATSFRAPFDNVPVFGTHGVTGSRRASAILVGWASLPDRWQRAFRP
jgi:hypothetical protein